jgi:hypothetical protein
VVAEDEDTTEVRSVRSESTAEPKPDVDTRFVFPNELHKYVVLFDARLSVALMYSIEHPPV